ncbi:MAG: hypothetical protein KA490_15105 [Giesbergeria sp.]|nr:hypothetical protein [Giesbergeria sp.]HOX67163.1 hypothetical protein [Burkholderiaceae bacterium]
MLFSLNPQIDLIWRDWGDESVAMEAASGRVFLFDPLSSALLACFESGPQQVQAAVDSLLADLGSPTDSRLQEFLRAALDRFVALGWLLPGDA